MPNAEYSQRLGIASQQPSGPGALWSLHHDAWGRTVLTDASGRQQVGVQAVRAFPLSSPRHGVSICDADGTEVIWIDCLDELPDELRRALEEHLAHREFVPIIQRVLAISAAVEPSEWEVETNRGCARFLLQSEEDVHHLDDHTTLITDTYGVRYLIPDTRRLDAGSCRLLERFL